MVWVSRARVPFEVRREMRASVFLSGFCDLFPFHSSLCMYCHVRDSMKLGGDLIDFRRTNELLAVAFAGERFGTLVHPVDVLVEAVLRR
jgi:hypothetical protein